jgi:hypothetical protein
MLGACSAVQASPAPLEAELYDLTRNLLTATKAANESPSSWTNQHVAPNTAHKRSDPISKWLHQLREKSGWQKAAVAMANKTHAFYGP